MRNLAKHIIFSIIVLTFLRVSPASGGENASRIYQSITGNGAAVVGYYMPGSPIVTVQVRVRAGLSNEGKYAGTGISHFLEHLIFKGTHDKSNEEVFGEIRLMGGLINGFTGMDSAAYHLTVPVGHYEEAVDLLVDLVMEPEFSAEEMEKERKVILKEIKMHEDDPASERTRRLFHEAYLVNVYKYPIIGYEDMFMALTREDVLEYHEKVYTPNRIVIGIAGGVDPDRAVKAAEDKISGYKRKKPWVVTVEPEPEQISARKARFEKDVSMGYLAIGFHTTSLFSEDLYPVDVLSYILGGGSDSRLYRELVRDKELLYNVSAGNMTPRYPGLFVITGEGDADDIYKAEKEIFSVIEKIKAEGVRKEELNRPKQMISSAFLRANEKIDSMLFTITSSYMLTGDPAYHERYVDNIMDVTPADVKSAAEKYLNTENSTTIMIFPEDHGQGGHDGGGNTGTAATGKGDEEEKTVTLDNGLKLIMKKRPRLPIAAVEIIFPGGLVAESAVDNGISNLTASLLIKGTKDRTEREIAPVFENMGGSIGTFSGKNSLGVYMDILSRDLETGLEIMGDVVMEPVFPAEEIEKLKKKIKASIMASEKSITRKADDELKKMLYGDHPYSRRTIGTEETIRHISRDGIVKFHKDHFSPDGAVMTIVGDISFQKAEELVRSVFGSWSGRKVELQKVDVREPAGGIIEKDIEMRKEQSLLILGFRGVDIYDERKYPLAVISSILSGGGGILFREIREEKGLAYSAGAWSSISVEPGYFAIQIKTTEANLQEVRKEVMNVIRDVRAGMVSDDDIKAAKNRMMTAYANQTQTNMNLSRIMCVDELVGIGYDYFSEYPGNIERVTKDDIVDCAGEILDLENHVVVTVHSVD